MESVSFVRGREKERITEKENRKIFIYYFENENFFGLNLNESRLGHKLRKRETKCVCVCSEHYPNSLRYTQWRLLGTGVLIIDCPAIR